ncbi:DUF4352 domain-containing protein [Tissierella creatinini]|nr:DUF4352 domain-containing protein [Tissierella creatinini]
MGGFFMENKNMTTCKACGKEIAKGVKKCVHCGKDQRSFFKKHKILTGILVLVLIGSIGATLGDDPEQKSKVDEPTQQAVTSNELSKEAVEEEKPKEEIYNIGESFVTGDLGVVVDSVEETTEFKSNNQFIDNVTTEGKFIVISAKLTNNDKESRTISSMQFRIIDNQDRSFDASNDTNLMVILGDEYLFLDDINPGMSKTGVFVFEVPNDINEYFLEVDSGVGFAAGTSAKVKLK